MPIASCPGCGTQLKAPENAVGKKAKCKKCHAVFTISADTVQQPAMAQQQFQPQAPAYQPPMPQQQPMPQHQPMPQQQPSQLQSHAPQQMPGQAQGYAPPMPGGYQDPQHMPPAGAPTPNPYGDDQDDFDKDRRSRRGRGRNAKKKGFPVMLVVLLGVGGVFLITFVVLGIIFLPGILGGGSSATQYLPDDSNILISVRVKQLLDSDAFDDLSDELPGDFVTKMYLEAEKNIGIHPSAIDTVTVAGNGGNNNMIFLVRTHKAYTARDILDNRNVDDTETETVNGKKIYKTGNNVCFCEVERNTFLFGQFDTLDDVLGRKKAPDLSDDMRTALGRVNYSSTISGCVSVEGDLAKGSRGDMPEPEYAWWDINVRNDIDSKFTAYFKTYQKAERALKNSKKEMRNMEKMLGLDDLEVQQSGNQVSMTSKTRTRDIAKNMRNNPFLGMIGGGFGGGGFNNGGGFNKGGGFNNGGGITKTEPIWSTNISSKSQSERTYFFRPGEDITIRVTAFPQGGFNNKPDVDLFVYRSGSNIIRYSDNCPNNMCELRFRCNTTIPHRVQVRNQGTGTVRATVVVTRRSN